jgi:hypothetical protein
MTRPAHEAKESHKGFQAGAGRLFAARRAHAYLTFMAASGLTLAILIAVATVSMEVVTAAALH